MTEPITSISFTDLPQPSMAERGPRRSSSFPRCATPSPCRDPDEDTLNASRHMSRAPSPSRTVDERDSDFPLSQNPTIVAFDSESRPETAPSYRKASHVGALEAGRPEAENQPPSYLMRNVNKRHTDWILVVCFMLSGLVDSLAFNGWGCFVSMQSGNTVFVGLGASGHPANKSARWAKSLVSIGVYLVGSLCFSRVCRAAGPLRRITLSSSFLIQASLVFIAAALEQTGVVPSSPDGNGANAPIDWRQLLPVSLLAFQASGQVVTSRLLGMNDLPTVVLTTLYCDLMADKKLFDKINGLRNKRVAAAVALCIGAIIGGWMSKLTGMGSGLWLCGAVKLTIALVWILWKEESKWREA